MSYERLNLMPPQMRRRTAMRGRHVSWPTEMDNVQELGIIADMQCGGWSTHLLTSKGALYSVGVLDGLRSQIRQAPNGHVQHMQQMKTSPHTLRFPPGFPHPTERYDPATAVEQFSAGRSHVLALSDSGRIWSWDNIDQGAQHVKFLNVDLKEGGKRPQKGTVKKVVAGWNKSAALVEGEGIVLWDPLTLSDDDTEIEDTALVLESATVPDSGHQRSASDHRSRTQPTDSEAIGEVTNFIVLEHLVVFCTHLGKVFASQITWTDETQSASPVFPVPLLFPDSTSDITSESTDTPLATDIQGSFRSFAIFTSDGRVLTGIQDDHLFALSTPGRTAPPLSAIPALQHTNVISIAFGDYHYHALHSTGHITSYGQEPQGCGALGLGGRGDPEGRLRGIRYMGIGGDGRLIPQALVGGRRVWFEKEKKDWIAFITSGGRDPEEARERMRMLAETDVQGEVSEWVEREGNTWEERFGGGATGKTNEQDGEDQLPSYFALSVTAAGWHSGALVLVDEKKADRIRHGCIVHEDQTKDPKLAEDPQAQQRDAEPPGQQSGGFIASTLAWATDMSRWFLGLPTSADAAATAANPGLRRGPRHLTSPFADPVNHGAATGNGQSYVWAADYFPRLRLRDGREMPGSAPFSEWRS
ncbi:hypothetical protein M8818_000568 [Zalaria obscura]|uniref:Uncharacterized protein n=1 Tax=Zalaria obscura TaxID=2024903 RepID=A0ACC3SNW5_9PEZI